MIIKNVTLNGEITDIITENGKIASIGKTAETGFDACGAQAIPGLTDIHAHGCMGHDTMDGDLSEMADFLARRGTTTWYPTTMTCSMDDIIKAASADTNVPGANIPGFHLEGPFISPKHKGAQNEKFILKPDIGIYNKVPNVKLITVAPEVEGCIDFIKKCDGVVCLGHTDTDYDTAVNAIHSGAKCLTHTFNAMPPFHHRAPSVIGAAVTENAYVQVICDGFHVHRAAVLALYKIFGTERMVLISDSIRPAGLPDGEYESGGLKVIMKDGAARLTDGTIAGSSATLMQCVKTAISFGIPKSDAIAMASYTPARLMGLNKGEIKEGFDADILLTDENLDISHVIINGELYM